MRLRAVLVPVVAVAVVPVAVAVAEVVAAVSAVSSAFDLPALQAPAFVLDQAPEIEISDRQDSGLEDSRPAQAEFA